MFEKISQSSRTLNQPIQEVRIYMLYEITLLLRQASKNYVFLKIIILYYAKKGVMK